MNDDLPRSFCNGVDGWLRGGLRHHTGIQGVTDIAHLKASPEAHNPGELFKPLFSGLLRLTKRSRVSGVTIFLVQGLGDMIQIPPSESLTPLVHEFYLRGIGGFWRGHSDSGAWCAESSHRVAGYKPAGSPCRPALPTNDESKLSVA